MYDKLTPRFIKYAKINTRSDEFSDTVPTTQSQVDFALKLKAELEEIGLSDVEYNEENGYVTATLPANTDRDIKTIGFISHYDTADFNAENIQPQIHENYDGEDIVLNEAENIVLSPDTFPNLKNYVGDTIITTDGTTLLGSDDKSGVAEIISAVEYLLNNKDAFEHGKVRVAFGPDEEIGIGADKFDVPAFDADFAYTMDGGPVGELQYESFNAAQAVVTIQGQNVHPGTAKDKMVNALEVAHAFHDRLPKDEVPEKTDGYQGYFHLLSLEGTVEEAKLTYIIRDFDRDDFEDRKALFTTIQEEINSDFETERVSLVLKDQYYNMSDVLKDDMSAVNVAQKAMENIPIEPIIEPIRGGTDGSKISFMGLPTPNVFAGGENFHGRYEYVSVQSMEKAMRTIIEIIKVNAV